MNSDIAKRWGNRMYFGYTTKDALPIITIENINRYGPDALQEVLNNFKGIPFQHTAGPRAGQWKWEIIGDDAKALGKILHPYLISFKARIVDYWWSTQNGPHPIS